MPERQWVAAVEEVARRWTEPEHPPRVAATERTLAAENRFTEEGLAFALNHAADLVARGGLRRWMGDTTLAVDQTIGVISRGRTPLEGFFEAAGASTVAERVLLSLAPPSPVLVARFFEEVGDEAGAARVAVLAESELLRRADAVMGRGTEEDLESWDQPLDERLLAPERRLLQPVRVGVAVIDGSEDRRARSGLAEDILLHEGGTPQSVRAVFAPAGLSPDRLLEAMAGFREVFPPHDATAGTLALRVAYLEALGISLAVGPGFLVTRGEFEVQEGAHLRWVEYDSLSDVAAQLREKDPRAVTISTSARIREELARLGLDQVAMLDFGDAHRPEPGQPPLSAHVPEFLRGLSEGWQELG
jgi:hypothetical protein